MEQKIGEIFEHNGEWYQCIVGNDCENCAFNERKCYTVVGNGDPIGDCCDDRRKDNKNVIFKKLEKVGEPYEFDGHLFQSYHTFEVPIFTENYATVRESGNNSKISIELKQNKEDMEENKTTFPKEDNALTRTVYAYVNGKISDKELIRSIKEMSDEYPYNKNNLKPFSLELAKQGKPVCTRDGRKARIICFDRFDRKEANKQIVALVKDDDREFPYCYDLKGRCLSNNNLDLMMLLEKKEGWVNVYYDNEGNIYTDEYVFNTEKDAIVFHPHNENRKATVKIEWYE